MSADLREVWKRLAAGAGGERLATYPPNGSVQNGWAWGKFWRTGRLIDDGSHIWPEIETRYGSAMQGCKL